MQEILEFMNPRGGFSKLKVLSVLYGIFFVSLFLRSEIFTLPIAGLGVKPFHIMALAIFFVLLLESSYLASTVLFKYPSFVGFICAMLCWSVLHIIISGVSPGFMRGAFYSLTFVTSLFLHGEIARCAASRGYDPVRYLRRLLGLASLIVMVLITVKNIIYLPEIVSQYLAGLTRPKPAWNYMNYGDSINNEVVFSLMLLPLCFLSGRFFLSACVSLLAIFMAFLTKVDAAYLFLIFLFLIFLCVKFWKVERLAISILVSGLFLIPMYVVWWFISSDLDGLSGGELGRYVLWNNAMHDLQGMPVSELMLGGADIGNIISSFGEVFEIGEHVMDFHNAYINITFEFGLLVLILYLALFLFPLLRLISTSPISDPVVLFILFTILNSWFSPRGLDYLYWFLVPYLLTLFYRNGINGSNNRLLKPWLT